MKLDVASKIIGLDSLVGVAESHRAAGRSIACCHGCFDIVHPGHLRYLEFARQQADVLVVSLTGDDAIDKSDGTRPYIPQELRAENLAAIAYIDHVVICDSPTAEPVITALKPDFYIKGREYEHSTHPGFLAEKNLVESFRGRVIFSSGDVVFSSTNILQNLGSTLQREGLDDSTRMAASCARWGLNHSTAKRLIIDGFTNKRVLVVGDAVCDRYVFCQAVDVAGEAPILSVRPMHERAYLGAAAIIAAHIKALGGQPHLVSTVAHDEPSRELIATLDTMGIAHTLLPVRRSLPQKRRYIVDKQKLLKVDLAESQPLDSTAEREVLGVLAELRTALDAAIFTDFGYGTLTVPLLAEAMPMLRSHLDIIAGDISGTRRTLLAMAEADLLTPTERELRSVVGDFEESLPTIASRVMTQLHTPNLIVTLAERGCVTFRPRESDPAQWFTSRLRSEYLPSLAGRTDDLVGAGDALLATATLCLCAGASLPVAAYLGSAAAAVAISRVGNLPVTRDELLNFTLSRRELIPALHHHAAAG